MNVKSFYIGEGRQSKYPSIVMLLYDHEKRKVVELLTIRPNCFTNHFVCFQLELIGTGLMEVPVKITANQRKVQTIRQLDVRQTFQRFIHQSPPRLRWLKLHQDGLLSAEVLLSAELAELSAPVTVPERALANEPIPSEIRPTFKKFRLAATFIGIREGFKLSTPTAGRYKIELTFGDLKLESGFSGIAYKTNFNFVDPSAVGFALLPDQLSFWPSIVIKYLECSHKTPIVLGVVSIQQADKFYKDSTKNKVPESKISRKALKSKFFEVLKLDETFDIERQSLLEAMNENSSLLELKEDSVRFKFPKFLEGFTKSSLSQNKIESLESQYTWWCKFYNSNREQKFRNDKLQQLTVRFRPSLGSTLTFCKHFAFRFIQMNSRSKFALSILGIGLFRWISPKKKEMCERKQSAHRSNCQSQSQNPTKAKISFKAQ